MHRLRFACCGNSTHHQPTQYSKVYYASIILRSCNEVCARRKAVLCACPSRWCNRVSATHQKLHVHVEALRCRSGERSIPQNLPFASMRQSGGCFLVITIVRASVRASLFSIVRGDCLRYFQPPGHGTYDSSNLQVPRSAALLDIVRTVVIVDDPVKMVDVFNDMETALVGPPSGQCGCFLWPFICWIAF